MAHDMDCEFHRVLRIRVNFLRHSCKGAFVRSKSIAIKSGDQWKK